MSGPQTICACLRHITVNMFGVMLVASASQVAVAQRAGDADAGRELARTWCSNCHVVGSEQQQATSTGAPPFAAIANLGASTDVELHAFLQTAHGRMPDLQLSRNEIDNLAAYITSLRRLHRP